MSDELPLEGVHVFEKNNIIHSEEELDEDNQGGRFANEDVDQFMRGMKNPNTLKKTRLDMKIVHEFLGSRGEFRQIEQIDANELNGYLADLFINVRKRDGSEYEPVSLRCLMASIERHLTTEKYSKSIVKDACFRRAREALRDKQKNLKAKGKGNRPNRTRPLTDEEVELMFAKNIFSMDNPRSLVNLMWWNCCTYFGMRTGTECRRMRWGDLSLMKNAEGREYIQFTERQTKTRTGGDVSDTRKVPPRMFSTSGEITDARDPVSVFKKFRDVRPCDMNYEEAPFFLGVRNMKCLQGAWFLSQPMGEGYLGGILKNACSQVGITGVCGAKIANHTARKTLVKKLKKAGQDADTVAQITGWKDPNSIVNYHELDTEEHENVSHILSKYQKNTEPTSANPGSSVTTASSASSHSNVANVAQKCLTSVFHNSSITGGSFTINVMAPESGTKNISLSQ